MTCDLWLVTYNLEGSEVKLAPNVGLEPTTLRLRVSCSTDWASQAVHLPDTLNTTYIYIACSNDDSQCQPSLPYLSCAKTVATVRLVTNNANQKKKLTAEKRGDDFKMLALSLSISLLFPLQLSFLFNHGSSNLVNERRYVVVVISYVVVNEIL